jgi:hypothetical protein
MYFEIFLALMSFITSVLFFYYGQKNRKENRNGVGIFYIILGVVWLMLTFYNGYEAYSDYKFQQEMPTPAPAPQPLSAENTEMAFKMQNEGKSHNEIAKAIIAKRAGSQ